MDTIFLISRLFCGISFVFYNFIGFKYVESVLSKVRLKNKTKIIISTFNTIWYLGLSSLGLSVYVVYLCGFLTLVLEFMAIYKLTLRRVIYVASTFMFNIAATRNLVLSVVALVTFQPMNQISGNDSLYNFSLSISFFMLDIIMLLFIREKFVTFEDLSIFAQAKIQETYVAILSALIFAYIMIFSGTHSYNVGVINFTVLNLLTPITLSALYYVFLSYSIKMSKLFAVERRSWTLENQLKETLETKTKLENIAYIDPLTDAFSRRYCIEKISTLLETSTEFSLCFIDVDGLKIVNDTFGHSHGDLYLQMVADVLRTVLRHDDFISRMGGDEFVILLPNVSKEMATYRMEEAHRCIALLKKEKGLVYETCISYGVIEVRSDNALAAQDLIAKADMLMYDFKILQKMKTT